MSTETESIVLLRQIEAHLSVIRAKTEADVLEPRRTSLRIITASSTIWSPKLSV